MEKKILKKRQSASQETKELSEQGAEKSNSGLITAGMLLYSKTELSEARGRLFLVESVDAETGEITALGLTTKAGTDDSLWEIARTEENKLFKPYLAQLEAQYIFSHDWPFVIQPQCVQKSQLEELLEAREQYKKDNKLRRIMMREAPLEGTDKLQQQIKEMCDNFKRDPKQYMEYLRFAGQFYQFSIVHEGHEQKAGFIVGHETNRWVADTSDHNLLLIAPPGAGKTTGVFIPTIYYNARVNINTKGRGASMLIVDCKGTLYNECSAFLRKAGYRTPILNIRDVTRSSHFNLMHEVNCAMDEYMAATDKLDRAVKYGRAERYAKAVASQLVDNGTATVKSEASDYFVETSRGLITGIILLVSQYGQSEERHIISVFKVILEMNGQLESLGEDDGPQANKLEHLLTFCGNERIRYYTGAATSADLKTSMNIFSSALGKLTKFIDAELEQLLCSHDAELDADRFIENPTAVFLISPDENTSRHFINSLYIRNLMNDLIYLAESKYGGRCPRDWLLLIDEFGQQPAIEGVDAATAAIRSRGGRAMLSLQNLTQLEKQYNRTLADIIKGTGQTVMFSFVSPTALSSAKVFSEAMGKETVMTGSTTSAKGNTSVTRSMVGRPLMDAADIIALEREVFIVLKGGCRPFRSRAEGYYKYLDLGEHKAEELPALDFQEIITFDPEAFMRRNVKMPSCRLTRGMFD